MTTPNEIENDIQRIENESRRWIAYRKRQRIVGMIVLAVVMFGTAIILGSAFL